MFMSNAYAVGLYEPEAGTAGCYCGLQFALRHPAVYPGYADADDDISLVVVTLTCRHIVWRFVSDV